MEYTCFTSIGRSYVRGNLKNISLDYPNDNCFMRWMLSRVYFKGLPFVVCGTDNCYYFLTNTWRNNSSIISSCFKHLNKFNLFLAIFFIHKFAESLSTSNTYTTDQLLFYTWSLNGRRSSYDICNQDWIFNEITIEMTNFTSLTFINPLLRRVK